MSLDSDFTLKNSLTLSHRIAAALVRGAEAIRNEAPETANHANRLSWSKIMLQGDSGPENEAKRWKWMIIQNATIAASGDASTDNDIEFAVNSLIDYFSAPIA